MLKQNIEHDKYALYLIMPNIEKMLKKEKEDNRLYSEELENEINLFKERIKYNEICQEIEEEKKRFGY